MVSLVRGTAGRAFQQVTHAHGTAGRAFQQEDHVLWASCGAVGETAVGFDLFHSTNFFFSLTFGNTVYIICSQQHILREALNR